MSTIEIPDALLGLIEGQVANGHAASAAEFLEHAVRLYAEHLDVEDEVLKAAITQGRQGIEAGRFVEINGRAELREMMDAIWFEIDQDGLEHRAAE